MTKEEKEGVGQGLQDTGMCSTFYPGGWYTGFIFPFIKSYFLKKIYLFLAALGPRCCARAFSSCSKRGLLFVAVCRLLIEVASLVAEHGL